MRLSRASQTMMAKVWDIHRDDLPDFWHWIPRAAGFLVVLGIGFLVGGALAGLGAFGRLGSFSSWVGLVLSLVVNVLMYWGAFAIVVHIPRQDRAVWPGAVIGGVGWTLLQFAGAQLVSHQLRHLSNLYGTFATILGPHLVDRPRGHDHRLRGRGQCGADPAPLATPHPPDPWRPRTGRSGARGRIRTGGTRPAAGRPAAGRPLRLSAAVLSARSGPSVLSECRPTRPCGRCHHPRRQRRRRQWESQASGSVVSLWTEGGSVPETISAMVTCSSTDRRLARTATHTSWSRSAGPS